MKLELPSPPPPRSSLPSHPPIPPSSIRPLILDEFGAGSSGSRSTTSAGQGPAAVVRQSAWRGCEDDGLDEATYVVRFEDVMQPPESEQVEVLAMGVHYVRVWINPWV
jgi:hypothetical protein